jgi:hypothetical protein
MAYDDDRLQEHDPYHQEVRVIPKSIRWRLPLSYAAIALLATLALGLVMLLILRSYYLQRERTYLNGNAAVISQELINLIEPDIDPLLLASQLRSFSFLSQTQIRFLDPAGVVIVDSGNPRERRDLIALSVDMDIEAKGDQLTLPDEIDPNSPTEGFQSFIFLQDEVSDGPAKTEDVSAQLNGEVTITSTRKTHLSLFNGEQEVVERQIVHQTGPLSLFSAVGTPYGFGLNLDAPTSANAPRSDQMVLYPVREPGGTLHGYIELSNGPA